MLSHIGGAFSGAYASIEDYAPIEDMAHIGAILLTRSHGWTDEEKGHDMREWQNALEESARHEHARPDFYLASMEELELRAAGYPFISLLPVHPKKRVIKSLGPGDL